MYQKCPKCGHERAPDETGPADVCPACGLIFSKYLKARVAPLAAPAVSAALGGSAAVAVGEPPFVERARSLLFYVPDEGESVYVYLRAALVAALVVYGVEFGAMEIARWEVVAEGVSTR